MPRKRNDPDSADGSSLTPPSSALASAATAAMNAAEASRAVPASAGTMPPVDGPISRDWLIEVGQDPKSRKWHARISREGNDYFYSPPCDSEQEAHEQKDRALRVIRDAFSTEDFQLRQAI